MGRGRSGAGGGGSRGGGGAQRQMDEMVNRLVDMWEAGETPSNALLDDYAQRVDRVIKPGDQFQVYNAMGIPATAYVRNNNNAWSHVNSNGGIVRTDVPTVDVVKAIWASGSRMPNGRPNWRFN